MHLEGDPSLSSSSEHGLPSPTDCGPSFPSYPAPTLAQKTLKNEDRSASLTTTVGAEQVQLLLIADGHGGSTAAIFCAERVLQYIVDEAAGNAGAESLQSACRHAFARVNSDVLTEEGTSGATLTVVIINAGRGELTVANVGDSAALLVDTFAENLLTEEHRLSDSTDERDRVIRSGGKLGQALSSSGHPGGPVRVWPGGLAVCRTIGDSDCPVASAVPAVRTLPFDSSAGTAVVVASDGVWDALTHKEVAACVRKGKSLADVGARILKKVLKMRGLRDDTTALVSCLGTPPWEVCQGSMQARLGRKLGLFGSRSPTASSNSASPTSSHTGSPFSSGTDLASLAGTHFDLDDSSAHGWSDKRRLFSTETDELRKSPTPSRPPTTFIGASASSFPPGSRPPTVFDDAPSRPPASSSTTLKVNGAALPGTLSALALEARAADRSSPREAHSPTVLRVNTSSDPNRSMAA
mmetsp:Transcript_45343/g.119001  ORF Transcript_45343/g.119001 Transcript_45343/m.119001 type:complete len:467 (+) Transcript_45343:52-1452(+)